MQALPEQGTLSARLQCNLHRSFRRSNLEVTFFPRGAAMKHRTAAEVNVADLVEALDCIAFVSIKQGKPLYEQKDFKKVPDWQRGQKLIPCLHRIVGLTGGRGILHMNMRGGVVAWNQKHQLGLHDSTIDDIAYSVRALLSQLLNMKSRKPARQVPLMWQPKYQTLFDKLVIDGHCSPVQDRTGRQNLLPLPVPTAVAMSIDSEVERVLLSGVRLSGCGLRCQSLLPLAARTGEKSGAARTFENNQGRPDFGKHRGRPDLGKNGANQTWHKTERATGEIWSRERQPPKDPLRQSSLCVQAETIESSEGQSYDPAKLFSSDNPALQRLLRPRCRVRGKSSRPEFDEAAKCEARVMEVDEIEKLAGSGEVQLVPRDFAALNKKLKKKDATVSETKPQKKSKKSKGKKAVPTSSPQNNLSFKTFLKREHSKVYHSTRNNHEKAGMCTETAKQLATEAARAKAAELRSLFESGKLPDLK